MDHQQKPYKPGWYAAPCHHCSLPPLSFTYCAVFSAMPVRLPTIPSTCFPAIRKRLVETGFYLGDISFQDNVHWVRDGRADRLVVRPVQPSGDAGEHLPSPPPDDSSFDLAPISAVIQIDSNDYWLMADANYRAPMEICPDFAIIKPSCIGHMPDTAPFTADWGNVTDNLCWLQDGIATPNFTMKQGLFTTAGPCGPRFKMRHILFEVCLSYLLRFFFDS